MFTSFFVVGFLMMFFICHMNENKFKLVVITFFHSSRKESSIFVELVGSKT